MKKILFILGIAINIGANAQLQTVTNGAGNNVTTNPIIVNGDGTNYGVYVGHGEIKNLNTQPGTNGIFFTNTAAGFNTLKTSINLPNISGNNGEFNTAFGCEVLKNLTTGLHNTGVGYHALSLTTAGNNSAFGSSSLATNTTGA